MKILWMRENISIWHADCDDFDHEAREILGQAPVAVEAAGLCDPYVMLIDPKTKCEDINYLATYLYGGIGIVYGTVVIGTSTDGVITGLAEIQAESMVRYLRDLKKCMEGKRL